VPSSTDAAAGSSVQQLLHSLPRSVLPLRTSTRASALSLSPDDFAPTVHQQGELPIYNTQPNASPSTRNLASSPFHSGGKSFTLTARATPRRIAEENQSPASKVAASPAATAAMHRTPN